MSLGWPAAKRFVLWGLAGTGLGLWSPVRAYYSETAPQAPVMLRDGPEGAAIWGVWTGHSFAYGIETGRRSAALIDAGSDPGARAIIRQLAARNMQPEDVHTIVLTHGHDEVQAGLAAFANAAVYVGPEDWPLARRDALPGPWLARLQAKALRRRALAKPAMQPMWPGQRLAMPTHTAHLVALPGHTWGSFAVVVQNIAFVGDSVAGLNQASGQQGPRLFGRWLSASPRHNGWALRRLVGQGFAQMATTHAGVLAYDDAALAAWLQTQEPPPTPTPASSQLLGRL